MKLNLFSVLVLSTMMLASCNSKPTPEPTEEPTVAPTVDPTVDPTPEPTEEPTPEPSTSPDPKPLSEPLEIYVLEMYGIYGDSIYMRQGDIDVLIDSGWDTDGAYVRDFVKQHMTGSLDLLVASHPHGDHVGGMETILNSIDKVDTIIDYGSYTDSANTSGIISSYENKKAELISKGTKYIAAYNAVNNDKETCKKLNLNENFSVEVLNTNNYYPFGKIEHSSDPNGHSVAVLFRYQDFTFFSAGDLTSKVEAKLMRYEPSLKNVTMYKASHHGSGGSNSAQFLNKLNPKEVVISASRALNYNDRTDTSVNKNALSGHPHDDAIERIYATKYIRETGNVYWNMYAGTMKFVTYGLDEAVPMKGFGPRLGYYTTIDGKEVKVTGEENAKFQDTVVFKARGYERYLK